MSPPKSLARCFQGSLSGVSSPAVAGERSVATGFSRWKGSVIDRARVAGDRIPRVFFRRKPHFILRKNSASTLWILIEISFSTGILL